MSADGGLTGIPASASADGPTGSQGPTGALGPTGIAPAYVVAAAPHGTAPPAGATGAINPTCFWTKDGEWYAFRFEGRDFFARVQHDLTTGYLELTEIDDPYKESSP